MSNTLTITVATFTPLGTEEPSIAVVAQDSYGTVFEQFDDVEHLLNFCPTEKALLKFILEHVEFDGCSATDEDGNLTFDVGSVEIVGFPC